jgi:hypothetical protein
MKAVEKVINIALAEDGYVEKSTAAYRKNPKILDNKTAGAGFDNWTKYGRDMHAIYPTVMDFPAWWCDCFVDWCFYTAFGVSNAKKLLAGDFNDYTVASAQLYKNKGAWYKTPQVGDQVFFTNVKGGICHTGLVYAVDANRFYTIEGNTSANVRGVEFNGGCVAKKSYSRSYVRVAGFGRPNYAYLDSLQPDTKPTPVPSKPKAPSNKKPEDKYFKKYEGKSVSIVEALKSIGCNTSLAFRKDISVANGITKTKDTYTGTVDQNTKMLSLLKEGKLKRA